MYDFVKDLDWVGRDLKRTVLLDAKPFCFWPNPNNGNFFHGLYMKFNAFLMQVYL